MCFQKQLKKVLPFFVLLILTQEVKTDGDRIKWVQQSVDTEEDVFSLSFIDASNGWAVGTKGLILKTSNGGNDWQPLEEDLTQVPLFYVYFKNANLGWIAGFGVVLHTQDGGKNWISQESNTDMIIRNGYFINDSTGWLVGGLGGIFGEGSVILHTKDAGNHWKHQTAPVNNPLMDVFLLIMKQDGLLEIAAHY